MDQDKPVLDRPPKTVQPIRYSPEFLGSNLFYWLRRLGEARDGGLVLLAFWYLLGYSFWSLHVLKYRAGMLPPLDLRYLLAGILLSLIIALTVELWHRLRLLTERWPEWVGAQAEGRFLTIRRALLWLSNLSFPAFGLWWLASYRVPSIRAFGGPLFAVLLLLTALRPPTEGRLGAFFSFLFRKGFVHLIPFVAVLPGVIVSTEGMARWPQALGGTLPRCASLDLDAAGLSRETYRALVSVDAPAGAEPVVRTVRLQVLFSGNDLMLIRAGGRVYELRQQMVRAVHPCQSSTIAPRMEHSEGLLLKDG